MQEKLCEKTVQDNQPGKRADDIQNVCVPYNNAGDQNLASSFSLLLDPMLTLTFGK